MYAYFYANVEWIGVNLKYWNNSFDSHFYLLARHFSMSHTHTHPSKTVVHIHHIVHAILSINIAMPIECSPAIKPSTIKRIHSYSHQNSTLSEIQLFTQKNFFAEISFFSISKRFSILNTKTSSKMKNKWFWTTNRFPNTTQHKIVLIKCIFSNQKWNFLSNYCCWNVSEHIKGLDG